MPKPVSKTESRWGTELWERAFVSMGRAWIRYAKRQAAKARRKAWRREAVDSLPGWADR